MFFLVYFGHALDGHLLDDIHCNFVSGETRLQSDH